MMAPFVINRIRTDRANSDSVPTGWSPGHYLTGALTLAKDDSVKKAVQYPFKYVLTENGSKKSSSKSSSSKSTEAAGGGKTTSTTPESSAETEEKKKLEEEFSNAVRDLKLQVHCRFEIAGILYNIYRTHRLRDVDRRYS